MQKSIDIAVRQALDALYAISDNKSAALSNFELALALYILPGTPTCQPLRQTLTTQILQQMREDKTPLYTALLQVAAIWQHDQTAIHGQQLAEVVQKLIAAETAPGGPYHTPSEPNILLNICAALFARTVAKPLPAVEAFLQKQLIFSETASQSVLTTDTHQYVLHALQFYSDKPCPAFLTGILHIQALHNLQTFEQPQVLSQQHRSLQQAISQTAVDIFASYAEPLHSTAQSLASQLLAKDTTGEISLLSTWFWESLRQPPALTQKQHIALGVANLCGWMAYTVYDDVLDGSSETRLLPAANVALRASLQAFAKVSSRGVSAALDQMDTANAWEIAHCRFAVSGNVITLGRLPDYTEMSPGDRSAAHTLGTQLILARSGCQPRAATLIATAFAQYRTARQLADDLRDWPEDIRTGQISYVVAAILTDMAIEPGHYNLTALVADMQTRFATTLISISSHIEQLLDDARQNLAESKLLRADNDIYILLDQLRQAVQHSTACYSQTQAFLLASQHTS